MEEWRKIPGFPPEYEASSYGRIRRLEATYWRMSYGKPLESIKPARILRQCTSRKGYLCARVCHHLRQVHRMIGAAFIDNPENKPQINHKNSIKTDNRPENLEWVTNQENRDHSVKNRTHSFGEKCKWSKLKEEQVIEIKKLLAQGWTQAKTAQKFNVSSGCIQQIADGHNWTHLNG